MPYEDYLWYKICSTGNIIANDRSWSDWNNVDEDCSDKDEQEE